MHIRIIEEDLINIKSQLLKISEVKYPHIYNKEFEIMKVTEKFFRKLFKNDNEFSNPELDKIKLKSHNNTLFYLIKIYSDPIVIFLASGNSTVFDDYKFFNNIDDFNMNIFLDMSTKRIILSKINNVFNDIFKRNIHTDEESWHLNKLGYYSYLTNDDYVRNFVFDLNVAKDIRSFNNIIFLWHIICENNRVAHKITLQFQYYLDYIVLYELYYDNFKEEKIIDEHRYLDIWEKDKDRDSHLREYMKMSKNEFLFQSEIERIKNINFESFSYPSSIIFEEWKKRTEEHKKKLYVDFLKKPDTTLIDFYIKHKYTNDIDDKDLWYVDKSEDQEFVVNFVL